MKDIYERCLCAACAPGHPERPAAEFRYLVVEGAGVFVRETAFAQAAAALPATRERWPRATLERAEILSRGARRYERLVGGRWVDSWEADYGVHADEERPGTPEPLEADDG